MSVCLHSKRLKSKDGKRKSSGIRECASFVFTKNKEERSMINAVSNLPKQDQTSLSDRRDRQARYHSLKLAKTRSDIVCVCLVFVWWRCSGGLAESLRPENTVPSLLSPLAMGFWVSWPIFQFLHQSSARTKHNRLVREHNICDICRDSEITQRRLWLRWQNKTSDENDIWFGTILSDVRTDCDSQENRTLSLTMTDCIKISLRSFIWAAWNSHDSWKSAPLKGGYSLPELHFRVVRDSLEHSINVKNRPIAISCTMNPTPIHQIVGNITRSTEVWHLEAGAEL
jgi:hypothetical protein